MKKIPPLTKKNRTWANTDPESMAAALFNQEIDAASNQPSAQPPTPQPPTAQADKQPKRK